MGGWVGGWSDKTKLMLNSTQVKVLVEVEVELGKMYIVYFDCPYVSILPKWGLTEICKEKLFAPFSW